tara:strand:- start:331 stop:579 length:249 start_codon:yes stop_codon:yes gene_type:complete
MSNNSKHNKLLELVIKESMSYKNKAKEIESWLLKLDLDPSKDIAYITMVGYIRALEFVISKAKEIKEGSDDKTYRAKFFNKD